MKKIFTFALIAAFAFSLYGCGSILVDVDSSAPVDSSQSQNELTSEETPSETPSENIQLKEYDIKQELKASIKYYKDVVTTELPRLAEKGNSEDVIDKMEEAISRLDSDTDKYLEYMEDETLSEDVRKACENVKTAFYGISSTVLKPTLAIIKGESSDEAPDYGTMVIDAETNYLDSAEKLIK